MANVTETADSAKRFDQTMLSLERRFFPDAREWVVTRASGDTVEVAIGTGLNLPYYGADVRLTGVDLSPAMLAVAVERAAQRGRKLHAVVGDAAQLPFADASFDSLVCTFALCEVPDVGVALTEFARVLRPGGRLLLADHVVATTAIVRLGQRLLEAITIPASGEHYTRRPAAQLPADFTVVDSHRRTKGAVEYVEARTRPASVIGGQ
ncbi:MAG: SAM-dependent methyltransferase [Actinobacteria bacterium HGW-Actinobacteria-2]|nr:MAG: SAM-dependent methyltransferase [Actinobacteria bacterium HGW-Actinobacteria-2]